MAIIPIIIIVVLVFMLSNELEIKRLYPPPRDIQEIVRIINENENLILLFVPIRAYGSENGLNRSDNYFDKDGNCLVYSSDGLAECSEEMIVFDTSNIMFYHEDEGFKGLVSGYMWKVPDIDYYDPKYPSAYYHSRLSVGDKKYYEENVIRFSNNDFCYYLVHDRLGSSCKGIRFEKITKDILSNYRAELDKIGITEEELLLFTKWYTENNYKGYYIAPY